MLRLASTITPRKPTLSPAIFCSVIRSSTKKKCANTSVNNEAVDWSIAAKPLVMLVSPHVISEKGMVVLPMPMMISGSRARKLKGKCLPRRNSSAFKPSAAMPVRMKTT